MPLLLIALAAVIALSIVAALEGQELALTIVLLLVWAALVFLFYVREGLTAHYEHFDDPARETHQFWSRFLRMAAIATAGVLIAILALWRL